MSNQEDFKASIEYWAEKWEKAQKDGVFKEAPKPVVNPQTATDSFWGMSNTNPTEKASDVDSAYWRQVSSLSAKYGSYSGDPMEMISEVAAAKAQKGDIATNIAQTPNPIRHGSVGMDQGNEPTELGMTYSDDNLNKLSDLKLKLHGLMDKLTSAQAMGAKYEAFESQIEDLTKKIDELSNSMSGGGIDQEGD